MVHELLAQLRHAALEALELAREHELVRLPPEVVVHVREVHGQALEQPVDHPRVLDVEHGRGPRDDRHLLGLERRGVLAHQPRQQPVDDLRLLDVERRERVQHRRDVARVELVEPRRAPAEHVLAQHVHDLRVADLRLGVRVQDHAHRRRREVLRGELGEHLRGEEGEDLLGHALAHHALGKRVHRDRHGLRVELGGVERLRDLGHVLEQRAVADAEARERVHDVVDVLRREALRRELARDAREVLDELLVDVVGLGARVEDQRDALRLQDKLHLAHRHRHPLEQRAVVQLRLRKRVHDRAHRLRVEEKRVDLLRCRRQPAPQLFVQ
eukprot:3370271-Rhodomonas_salina.2